VEHLRHFQLSDDPFRNEPLMRALFEAGPQEDALRRLERSVRQARGLTVLIGASGSGKTMTVRRLLDRLEEDMFEAGMMVVLHGAADASWMLRRYAVQLGVEEPAAEREKLIAQIYESLAIVREDGRHAILIIDDADALAKPSSLAEICGLLKLEYEDRRLLSLVLTGPKTLADSFAGDSILAHQVDVRVQLAPFDQKETAAYLDHRIRQVAGEPSVLEPDAIAALRELGAGYPGRMNKLADNALFEAFLCGRKQVARVDVERAHGDLGWSPDASAKLPAPSLEVASGSEVTFEDTLNGLDQELAGVLSDEAPVALAIEDGPPKDEVAEPEDLLVELVDG
jgi:general secretion pathway protein A